VETGGRRIQAGLWEGKDRSVFKTEKDDKFVPTGFEALAKGYTKSLPSVTLVECELPEVPYGAVYSTVHRA